MRAGIGRFYMEVEKEKKEELVPIFIMGKRYEVPSSLTLPLKGGGTGWGWSKSS